MQWKLELNRRFPPPWSVEELNDACFDSAGQKLAYVYFRTSQGDDQQPSCSAKMRRGGSRRISPSCRSYWGVDAQLPHPSVKRNDGKPHFVFEIGRPVHAGCQWPR